MAGIQSIRLTGPRGRFVQGDLFKPNTTDKHGAPLVIKTGPNAGQPTQEWIVAVAYRKDHPETMPYIMQLVGFAAQAWPRFFPSGPQSTGPMFGSQHPNFSFKIYDGDGIDGDGKPNRDKPGFAGCWVVKYSTRLQAPGVWQEPNFAELDRITDPRQAPRGYYVRVNHTVDTNDNDQRPGIYVNLDKVAFTADQAGAEHIQSGISAAEAFGGASAPVPPSYAQPPVTPPAPIPAAYTPPAPVGGSATPSPSSPPPPPYSGFIPAAPTTAVAPPAPPMPAGPVMLPAANGASYEQMKAAGWTDELLRQHGMMA